MSISKQIKVLITSGLDGGIEVGQADPFAGAGLASSGLYDVVMCDLDFSSTHLVLINPPYRSNPNKSRIVINTRADMSLDEQWIRFAAWIHDLAHQPYGLSSNAEKVPSICLTRTLKKIRKRNRVRVNRRTASGQSYGAASLLFRKALRGKQKYASTLIYRRSKRQISNTSAISHVALRPRSSGLPLNYSTWQSSHAKMASDSVWWMIEATSRRFMGSALSS